MGRLSVMFENGMSLNLDQTKVFMAALHKVKSMGIEGAYDDLKQRGKPFAAAKPQVEINQILESEEAADIAGIFDMDREEMAATIDIAHIDLESEDEEEAQPQA